MQFHSTLPKMQTIMSLYRFVYYSAVIGGWAAFLAWLVAELLFLESGHAASTFDTVLTGALVGAAIGAGMNLVSGMSNPQWWRQAHRVVPGLIGGAVGGALGALLGQIVYAIGLPRALGWVVMGLGIGVADGLYEASPRKIRNGLIGGCLGGLVGGVLFVPIASAGSEVFSRATAFVILGLSIGALIGLTHVVLKEAWLTVVDGYGAGRQLILTSSTTLLGRGDHLPLPLLGYAGKDLESEHSEVVRQPGGTYTLRDKDSRIGTRLNGELLVAPTTLGDGDLIKLGSNLVRFNHRRRSSGPATVPGPAQPSSGGIAPPPPPGMPNAASPSSEGAPTAPQPPGTPGGPPPLPGAAAPVEPLQAPSSPPATGETPRIPPPPPPPS